MKNEYYSFIYTPIDFYLFIFNIIFTVLKKLIRLNYTNKIMLNENRCHYDKWYYY